MLKFSLSTTKALLTLGLGLALSLVGAVAQAQLLMMPDSTNNRLVLLSAQDGSVVNPNLFDLVAGSASFHALSVAGEIWISEQIGDRISRWTPEGTPLGAISGGMDNVRGMGLVGDTVYLTNAESNNGAPGPAVLMFSTAGAAMGSFTTAATAPSPFGVLAHSGGLLVSSFLADDDIHRFSLAGTALGTFHNSATLRNAEQMAIASNGDILVAGFGTDNIVRLDASTGSVISTFAASDARGVAQLGNGNILWTNPLGAWVFDVGSASSTQVYVGGGRYLQAMAPVPESATVLMWTSGLLALAALGRRRGRAPFSAGA